MAQLDPGLEVQVIDHTGEWVKIRCSNDWEAWTDGPRLVAIAPKAEAQAALRTETQVPVSAPATATPAASAPETTAPAMAGSAAPVARSVPTGALSAADVGIPALLGGALVIVGSFLKWWTVGSASITAWHVPFKFVLGGSAGTGVDVGPFLLVVVLVALPLFTRRRLPALGLPAISVVPLVAGSGALARGLHGTPSLHPGIGLILTLAGGLLILTNTLGFASIVLRGRKR